MNSDQDTNTFILPKPTQRVVLRRAVPTTMTQEGKPPSDDGPPEMGILCEVSRDTVAPLSMDDLKSESMKATEAPLRLRIRGGAGRSLPMCPPQEEEGTEPMQVKVEKKEERDENVYTEEYEAILQRPRRLRLPIGMVNSAIPPQESGRCTSSADRTFPHRMESGTKNTNVKREVCCNKDGSPPTSTPPPPVAPSKDSIYPKRTLKRQRWEEQKEKASTIGATLPLLLGKENNNETKSLSQENFAELSMTLHYAVVRKSPPTGDQNSETLTALWALFTTYRAWATLDRVKAIPVLGPAVWALSCPPKEGVQSSGVQSDITAVAKALVTLWKDRAREAAWKRYEEISNKKKR